MVIIILYCYNYFGDKIMAKSNSFFNIDMLVLSLLKVSDCYGYELVKKIKEVSNNTLDIKEGTLYPVVHNLLKKEYISSRDEIVNKKVRVYYHIEPIGRDYLEKLVLAKLMWERNVSFQNALEYMVLQLKNRR